MRVYDDIGALARAHKALGDTTRLRIVHLLAHRGELCVCDVEAILGVSQSKASRHLAYLRHAGLVEDRRHGTWVYYRLAAGAHPAVRSALRAARKALAGAPEARQDLARAGAAGRAAGCAPLVVARGARR
jgi:ArsR family transcriptional regulator